MPFSRAQLPQHQLDNFKKFQDSKTPLFEERRSHSQPARLRRRRRDDAFHGNPKTRLHW
jgi:hypothetical protein